MHHVCMIPRLRFTFRCNLARVINLICICIHAYIGLHIYVCRPIRVDKNGEFLKKIKKSDFFNLNRIMIYIRIFHFFYVTAVIIDYMVVKGK